MNNERGIAIIITLLVVTLLTIAVVEFTYSVEIDQKLVHNSLSAMQSQMLARSGVNLGEAYLARKNYEQPPAGKRVDSYFDDENWHHPDVPSVIVLDASERLDVRILDESGKININRTRPVGPPLPPGQPSLSPDAFLRDAMRALFQQFDVAVDIVDRLEDYWRRTPTPTPAPGQREALLIGDFTSLEDFGALSGIPSSKLTKLSRFLTAIPLQLDRNQRININTAPVEVLAAVLQNNPDQVNQIIQQRDGQPIENLSAIQGAQVNGHAVPVAQIFGTTSSFFRIYASAMVDADPTGQRLGGVGQTVVALVQRVRDARVPPNAPANVSRWTFTHLDWQKRGGAELLVRQTPLEGEQGMMPADSLMDERF